MPHERRPAAGGFLPRVVVLLVVGALYIAACACPAVEFTDVPRAHDFGEIFPDPELGSNRGIVALLFGGKMPLPWSANIFLLVGCILLLLKKYRLACGLGTVAAILGFSTWALLDSDRMHQMKLLVGYYFWQASLLTLPAAALALWLRERRNATRGVPYAEPVDQLKSRQRSERAGESSL
jgi:hypothetical protein